MFTVVASSLVFGCVFAKPDMYGKFPITEKSYSGSKKDSTSYSGQVARHVLHNSLKKLAAKGNGQPNPKLKAEMLSYYAGKDKGRTGRVITVDWKRERLLIRLNDGNEINDEIKEGHGTTANSTKVTHDTYVDLCLNKDVENHANADIGLKTVKILDAIYRSMKNEKVEKI